MNIEEGQASFVTTKGFLVQAAPRLAYSMETVGDEPVLRLRCGLRAKCRAIRLTRRRQR